MMFLGCEVTRFDKAEYCSSWILSEVDDGEFADSKSNDHSDKLREKQDRTSDKQGKHHCSI